jgi:hypothetical protein
VRPAVRSGFARSPRPFVPRGGPCRPVGQVQGNKVFFYFPSTSASWLPARLEKVDGEWEVAPARRAG